MKLPDDGKRKKPSYSSPFPMPNRINGGFEKSRPPFFFAPTAHTAAQKEDAAMLRRMLFPPDLTRASRSKKARSIRRRGPAMSMNYTM